MAESIVQINEGVGKKLHTFQRTIGAQNVEDEVVLLGENYLATYNVNTAAGSILLTTATSHTLELMAGASLKVRVRRIEVYQMLMATAAAMCQWQLWRLTTAGTGGTAYTPAPLDPADAASGATAMSLPTVKGTESTLILNAASYIMQTVGASTPLNEPILVLDFDRPRSKPLIIPAGATNGIALKQVTGVAVASVFVNILFDETSF